MSPRMQKPGPPGTTATQVLKEWLRQPRIWIAVLVLVALTAVLPGPAKIPVAMAVGVPLLVSIHRMRRR